jgi:hypothetical protein
MTGASAEKQGATPTFFQPDDYLAPSPSMTTGATK